MSVSSFSFENKCQTLEDHLRKISGIEKETLLIDHTYGKPWNSHPDSNRIKPSKLLFKKSFRTCSGLSDARNDCEEIDIESFEEPPETPFDNPRTRLLSVESERNLKYTSMFGVGDEEKEIDISLFTASQKKLFQQVTAIIDSERIARLTFSGSTNGPLKNRLSLDKAARNMRQVFGLLFWDKELLGWLHKMLLSNSNVTTLSIYVDILQTMKSKMPHLIDRLLQVCSGSVVGDAVIQNVKKSWDPALSVLQQNKPKKVVGNPIILVCPSGPNHHSVVIHSARFKFWHNYLSSMFKVVNITLDTETEMTPSAEICLQGIMDLIKAKIAEMKNHYPNRSLVLLGWTTGALIACHLALTEPVDGIICLGFPLTGITGPRGDLSDPLLDIEAPTLFIVGQNANMCTSDDMEDFRGRMKADTGLAVLSGADDLLRMCPTKMEEEQVTQAMVDRCLIDEVVDFISQVILKLPSTPTQPTSSPVSLPTPVVCSPIREEDDNGDEEWKPPPSHDEGKRRRRKPREYSPEPAKKKARTQQPPIRQVPPLKIRMSPAHSEASSSGSGAIEKPVLPNQVFTKTPEKKVGRPSTGTWKKRTPTKPTQIILSTLSEAEKQSMNKARKLAEKYEQETLLQQSEKKTILPFSKIILPKKNESVDVDKAFGNDSFFLPRPLSPPEPEDTISAEETEKAMEELEGHESHTTESVQLERPFLQISAIEKESSPSESLPATSVPMVVTSVGATEKQLMSRTLQLPKAHTTTASLKTIKAGGISLLASSAGTSGKSTIITVPSASAASFLVSNPALKGQPGKMIQLLTTKNGGSQFTIKNSCSTSIIKPSEGPNKPGMMSLLTDKSEMAKKAAESGNTSATLVKVMADKSSMKCLKIVKTSVRAPSPPTRIETAEELVEKQLAIQELNKSIGIEPQNSFVKEAGYSICYAKADGSIVSRSVSRPSFSGITHATLSRPAERGRGRGRPPFTCRPKLFQM